MTMPTLARAAPGEDVCDEEKNYESVCSDVEIALSGVIVI